MEPRELRADRVDLVRLLSTVYGMDRESRLALVSALLLDRPTVRIRWWAGRTGANGW